MNLAPCPARLAIGYSHLQEGDGQINAVGKRLAWGEARLLAARRYVMFMTSASQLREIGRF